MRQRCRSAVRSSSARAASSRSTSAAAPAVMASALSVRRRSDSGTRRRFGAAASQWCSRLFGAASARLAWYGAASQALGSVSAISRPAPAFSSRTRRSLLVVRLGARRPAGASFPADLGLLGLGFVAIAHLRVWPRSDPQALHRGEPGRGRAWRQMGEGLPLPHAYSNALVRAKVQSLLTRWPQALGTSGFAHQALNLFSHHRRRGAFPALSSRVQA